MKVFFAFCFSLIFGVDLMAGTWADPVTGITWRYDINGDSVSIVGSDIAISSPSVGSVVVPSKIKEKPVTSIGDEAFANCASLVDVSIPQGVTRIGSRAFYGCKSLEIVQIPASVTSIGRFAFDEESPFIVRKQDGALVLGSCFYQYKGDCPVSVKIPEGVKGIGDWAFGDCEKLRIVSIPSEVTEIGTSAFRNCSSLTSITIPPNVTRINGFTFMGCTSLTSLTMPTCVVSIGDDAFCDCRALTSLSMPSGVKIIGYACFCGCRALTSLAIPQGVTRIENDTFCDCSRLTSITIPSNVTSIGSGAFSGCSSLKSLTIPQGVEVIEQGVFYGCKSLTSMVIPTNVTTIGNWAFSSCSSLKSIEIPLGVTVLNARIFHGCSNLSSVMVPTNITSIGEGAFCNCYSLKSLTLPTMVTNIGEEAFYNCNLRSVQIPQSTTSLGRYAFRGCAMDSVTIPSNVMVVSEGAFSQCHKLKTINVAYGVKSIGASAFYACSSLETVSMPCSVTKIDEAAFGWCDNVRNVVVPGWKCGIDFASVTNLIIADGTTRIGASVFSNSCSLVSVRMPSGMMDIGERAFSNCKQLESVVMPLNMHAIGASAFAGCSRLKSLVMPMGLTRIGAYAFSCCAGLKSVSIPNGITRIEEGLFYNCRSLASVTLPSSLLTIGDVAFCECDSLITADIPWRVKSIGCEAFANCGHLSSIRIPTSVTSVGDDAFSGRVYSLRSVTVPGWTCGIDFSTVTNLFVTPGTRSIPDRAFSNCERLRSLEIPASVTSIGANAFSGCASLDKVVIPSSVASVGAGAFAGCYAISSAIVPGKTYGISLLSVTNLVISEGTTSIDDNAFLGCRHLLSLTIPSGVTSIGCAAFSNCDLLTKVILPASVTHIGDGAFAKCGSLISFVVDERNPTFTTKNGLLLTKDGLTLLLGVNGDVEIPDGVQSIRAAAFQDCTSLMSVKIPASVGTIGDYSFSACCGLSAITIPTSVTNIGLMAFSGCMNLKDVAVPGWKCQIDFSNVTNLVILEETKSIEASAFAGCRSLKSVSLPLSLQDIGTSAFASCEGLGTVDVPPSVINVGSNAFYGCKGLMSVTLPQNLTNLSEGVFATCSHLTAVAMPTDLKSIGTRAFDRCFDLASVEIPSGVTNIGVRAFADCDGLYEVLLPASVSSVAEGAFADCDTLAEVLIPPSVICIGENAFENCRNLRTVWVYYGDEKRVQKLLIASGFEISELKFKTRYVTVASFAASGCETMGSVGKIKSVRAGERTVLTATANRGALFAGWYRDPECQTPVEEEYLSSACSIAVGAEDVVFYAHFITTEEDMADVSFELSDEYSQNETIIPVAVDLSGCCSKPTVKVAGLPPGLKFTANALDVKASKLTDAAHYNANTIYGTPTKSGVYTVVATVTTAGKKTASCSQTVVVRKASEKVVKADVVLIDAIGTIASTEAVPGKVTGMGVYAVGKKVALKATANKGYVFAGWYPVDAIASIASGGEEKILLDAFGTNASTCISRSASYSVEMPANDVELVAAFITSECDKANIAATVNGMALETGRSGIAPCLATNIWTGVYLEWPVAASALSETTVKVAGLPSGLKFTAKPVTTKVTSGSGKSKVTTIVTNIAANTIYGAPSAASKTMTDRKTGKTTVTPLQVKVTVTTAGKSSQTYQINTTVDPLPSWVQGTFAGPSYSDAIETIASTNGTVSVTIGANGKISAKQPVNGKSTSFAASYFDSYAADESAFYATLTAKVGKEVVTNKMAVGGMEMTVGDGTPTLPDTVVTNGYIEANLFDAWQYNWKTEPWKTLIKPLDKTTFTYVILTNGTIVDENDGGERLAALPGAVTGADSVRALPVDGENVVGKVTLKFTASGSVAVSGEFVSGYDAKKAKYTTVKATGSTIIVPGEDDQGLVFVYLTPKGISTHVRCVKIPWSGD